MRHLFEAQQLEQDIITKLFTLADTLENSPKPILQGKVMSALFYEPSTRTRLSFESAMHRLGGSVIGSENAGSFSSAVKGETLEDAIRVVGSYADIIVLRYFEKDIAKRLAEISPVPVINAGDGAGQHPTQALLDLYTLKRELNQIDGLEIALVGDTKYSRSVRSFAYLLGKFSDITIHFVSDPALRAESDITDYLTRHNVRYTETDSLDEVIEHVDVLYRNRIQRERVNDDAVYERCQNKFLIDRATVEKMKEAAIVMDPLPRVGGILTEVDDMPQAIYFKQPYYGLLVRMALLQFLLTD